MAEEVNNLLNFWKTHNISLSTNGLFNSSVSYSYPSVDNIFTNSIEIPGVESESVFGESTPTPAQTSNTGDIVNYRKKAYELNGLKADIEELEKNNKLTKNQKKELTEKKKAYNKGVKDLKGMYSESFKGSIPEQINLDKYQELEVQKQKQKQSKNVMKKKMQANATSAKKVSQQNPQLELNFGNSEITTNPAQNSNVEAEKAEKPPKSKTKSTKKGKLSKFFKGKKGGRFGAILAGIALVGAAIAYVVNKAGDKVDKAKDVKAEKPVENTTQIEEAPETVEPIPVAPENAPVQEEIDSDVVTVKSGDTVWDLCEQKLKKWGNDNPTAKQIRELVDKVMADEKNHLHWEHDNYTVIIEPEQKIRICKPEE